MDTFTIEFYKKENGDIPVEEFLLSLNVKMRAKLVGIMKILQEKGNLLREPYSKHIDDGIFELRGKAAENSKSGDSPGESISRRLSGKA